MDSEEAQQLIQAAYPRISPVHSLACHSQHQNARTTPQKLSQRDATLLAHLHPTQETSQSDLARHMGVAKSTLSEALTGLEEAGYILRRNSETDSRGMRILRTPAGTQAMSAGSVLESARLLQLLERLTEDQRHRAVEGMEILAHATETHVTEKRHAL